MPLIKEADRPPSGQMPCSLSTVPGMVQVPAAELLPRLPVPTRRENRCRPRLSGRAGPMPRRSGFGPWSGHGLGAGSSPGEGGVQGAAGQRFSLIADVSIALPSSL